MNGPKVMRPGMRLFSQTCGTEVVVVRAPSYAVELLCGGEPMMVESPASPESTLASEGEGTVVGKRYTDGVELEVLCTKAGSGTLEVDGELLRLRDAKPLPSSD